MSKRSPLYVPRDAGTSVWSLGGRFTVKMDGESSQGRYSMIESTAFRSTEPPLHVHANEDEAWYLLDGHMTFYVEEQVIEASAGDFVMAPMGLPHTFTVDIEPTRVLIIASPGGFEHFALELGLPAHSDVPPSDLAVPGPDVLAPVADRYGITVMGPPRRVSHPDPS